MPNETSAPQKQSAVTAGAKVTLHFSLALPSGELIDSNFEKDPASFVVGDGSLLPGFEEALEGLSAGDSIDVLLPADKAFGEKNPENVQVLPKQKFAGLLANSTDPVEPGTVLSFTDPGGFDIPGVVQSIDESTLVVDFNHPLAGRGIQFKAQVHAVIPSGVQVMELK
ncbi:MAG: peptidylprolyl isomerase [Pseudohongiellaceae bacterium]|nr:peptidylprolyl isomerase [Pseudohongiellaceae bacterium]